MMYVARINPKCCPHKPTAAHTTIHHFSGAVEVSFGGKIHVSYPRGLCHITSFGDPGVSQSVRLRCEFANHGQQPPGDQYLSGE